MIFENSMRGRRSDPGEEPFEMNADEVPHGHRVQLLCSMNCPAMEHDGDTHEGCPCLLEWAFNPVSAIVV
jgi:hypothetical protein